MHSVLMRHEVNISGMACAKSIQMRDDHLIPNSNPVTFWLMILQDEISSASNHSAGKVDKCLVKNLVVGYAAADAAKRPDVLRVIATVLDFNAEDRQRSGLEGGGGRGWLRQGSTSSSSSAALDQSLAQAFVQFLVNEMIFSRVGLTLIYTRDC